MRITLPLAAGACLAAGMAAQAPTDPLAGLRPFRSPQQNVEVPAELFRDLQVMLDLVEKPGEYEVYFDADGRENCTHPVWQSTREAIRGKLFNMATMFGLVLRDSRLPNDRKLAAYGTFFCEDPAHVFQLIAFLPGEPVREIREAAYRRALGYLRVHWPPNETRSAAPAADPDYPPQAKYKLEVGPFLALLDLDDVRDQTQGLWFLAELCRIRNDVGVTLLGHSRQRLRQLLVAEDRLVRQQAREFLAAADPARRRPPAADADDAARLAWLDAVLYDAFPPIRRVSKARTDLYPSADLDRLVEVGRAGLIDGTIGGTQQGRRADGMLYRGFRITTLPAPLDQLRLPPRSVVIAINGAPVATGAEILSALETMLLTRRDFIVEFVVGDQVQAMEYRVQQTAQ